MQKNICRNNFRQIKTLWRPSITAQQPILPPSAPILHSGSYCGFLIQKKLPSKRPEDVQKAIVQLLIPYKKFVLTITTDNGMEFRNHKAVCKALDCTVYFADPYCSGQKGAIENTNKLLREFFPKGTDFRMVTQQQLNQAQYAINERPRKKLDFSTPKVEFFKNIL